MVSPLSSRGHSVAVWTSDNVTHLNSFSFSWVERFRVSFSHSANTELLWQDLLVGVHYKQNYLTADEKILFSPSVAGQSRYSPMG